MQDDVKVALRLGRKRGEKLLCQLAIELADPLAFEAVHTPHKGGPTTEVDRHGDKHFVHRQGGPAVASDASAVAQCAFEGAAKHEADVFHRVMTIDLRVAFCGDVEVEHAVARKRVEHVGEKRHRCDDGARARAIEVQVDGDLGLLGVALNASSTRHDSLYQLPTDRTTSAMVHPRAVVALLFAACGGVTKNAEPGPQIGSVHADKAGPGTADVGSNSASDRDRHPVALFPAADCLPGKLKEDTTLRLELASIGKDPILCAVDRDKTRLAGSVACWKVDLSQMESDSVPLVSQPAVPLPNRNVDAMLVDGCARGFCLPKDATAGSSEVAHLAWNSDRTNVALLAGEHVHLFDAATKAHQSSFSVRGPKGMENEAVEVYLVGRTVFVVGAAEGRHAGVWVFRTDGKQIGPIQTLGGKAKGPVSPHRGAFSVLDPTRVAIADHGMETLTTYDVETGRRTKSVRKLPKMTCKASEVEAFWSERGKVTKKCRAALERASGMYVGATAILGSMNLLVALQGTRLGELAVIDPKSLAERRKPLQLPWCEAE